MTTKSVSDGGTVSVGPEVAGGAHPGLKRTPTCRTHVVGAAVEVKVARTLRAARFLSASAVRLSLL